MGTYLRGLVGALVRERGAEEIVLFHAGLADPSSLPGAGEPGVTAVALTRPRRAVTLWDQIAWPRTLARCGVDVFHSPFWALPVMAGAGRALVQTIHDLTPLKIPGSVSARNRMIFRINFRCARRARRVIVPSKATAADAERLAHIPAERIREVPEAAAIGEDLLGAAGGRLAGLRDELDLPGRYLLHTGGQDPVKDLGTALAATALLVARGHDLKLVVTGAEGRATAPLRARAAEAGMGGRLVLPGLAPAGDVVALYRGAAAVIYPSLNEGFGLPVLEAMTCGIPVVASRAGALPEVGGEACLYAPPGDPGAFADALDEILRDDALARRLSEEGRRRAAAFTWPEAARKTLDVYREAAA